MYSKERLEKKKNTIRKIFGQEALPTSYHETVQKNKPKVPSKLVLSHQNNGHPLFRDLTDNRLFLQEQKPQSISWLYGRRHNCSRKHSQSYFKIIILF
jgi:hypothetical protein